MQVEKELGVFSPEKDTILTVGVFDGVHLGHKRLISELLKKARKRDLLAGVVTFRQHPEDLFSKGARLPFLTDIIARTSLLKDAGVDFIIPLSFTTELASLEATDHITFYESFSYTTTIGRLLSVGAEVNLNPRMSLMLEYSRWLSQHDYPADFEDPAPRYPYTIGVAFSYHLVKTDTKYDVRDLATPMGSPMGSEPKN